MESCKLVFISHLEICGTLNLELGSKLVTDFMRFRAAIVAGERGRAYELAEGEIIARIGKYSV